MVNYYQVLGVPQNASTSDIKRAFHQLALQVHPDKNPGDKDAAEERFKKVAEAYHVLSDTKKRKDYDRSRWSRTTCEIRDDGRDKVETRGDGRDKTHLGEEIGFRRPRHTFPKVTEDEDLFSGDCWFTNPMAQSRRTTSPFFSVTPIMDTGFSTFVSLGPRLGTAASEMCVPYVSHGMGKFKLVTTCSQTVNGKRVVTKQVVEHMRGPMEVENERLFHQSPSRSWNLEFA
uniref:RIKEN cDNA 4930503B20 gene n=1 Tax=Cricetulus griseus TaxID=10029 RepID=A0A8C2MHF0_CRIGR